MKNCVLLILAFMLSSSANAQSDPIAKVMDRIEFGDDKIESTYKWIAKNISYDVKKLERIKGGEKPKKRSSFETREAYQAYLVNTVVKQKRGVCEDYSLLFDEIMQRLGYESYIVTGYTKKRNGKVEPNVGHAWNAVKVDGDWKLYDVTWAAGYVRDGKFTEKYNTKWYATAPEVFIELHMPFDPIWQLLDKPQSYEEFNENEAPAAGDAYDYKKLISTFMAAGEKEKMEQQLARSETMGEGVNAVKRWRKHLTKRVGIFGMVDNKADLQTASADASAAVELFNKYIAAKNKRFQGKRYDRETAKQYLLTALPKLESAHKVFSSVEVSDTKAKSQMSQNIRQVKNLLEKTKSELKWMEK